MDRSHAHNTYVVRVTYTTLMLYNVFMKILAERLKELRLEKAMSTMALGKAIGVSDMAICRWENDKNDIKAEQLAKIAKYFSVSSDYLIGLED